MCGKALDPLDLAQQASQSSIARVVLTSQHTTQLLLSPHARCHPTAVATTAQDRRKRNTSHAASQRATPAVTPTAPVERATPAVTAPAPTVVVAERLRSPPRPV
eukprot:5405927-Pleurochrysis_carterae.AAC.2